MIVRACLDAGRMRKMMEALGGYFRAGEKRRRVVMAVLGTVICAFAVAMNRMANFGVDPFQSLCSGLYRVIPMEQGLLYILFNAILLGIVFVLNRHYIGLGTLINLFLFGYVVDFSEQAMRAVCGTPDMLGRVLFLAGGILIGCVSVAMYITADLGVATYDAIVLHLVDRKVGPYRVIRTISDALCVLGGWLMGATVGLGTLFMATLWGVMIAWARTHITEPMLHGTLFGKRR